MNDTAEMQAPVGAAPNGWTAAEQLPAPSGPDYASVDDFLLASEIREQDYPLSSIPGKMARLRGLSRLELREITRRNSKPDESGRMVADDDAVERDCVLAALVRPKLTAQQLAQIDKGAAGLRIELIRLVMRGSRILDAEKLSAAESFRDDAD